MANAFFTLKKPTNEPVLSYAPGTPERAAVKEAIASLRSGSCEVPLVINGERVTTGDTTPCAIPHDHSATLGIYHKAKKEHVTRAIDAAVAAQKEWADMPWEDRVSIFLKAADLIAGPYRARMNAATMLTQSKNIFQAEIDAACEMVDFLRFNAYYATQIYQEQPDSQPGMWNRLEYRPLEGFVFAIAPFNFTSISGNLPTAPAIMGNTAVWKPASSAVYSSYLMMQIFEEAGLPPGVINFLPGSGATVGDQILTHPHLAGVHFTGSTRVFQHMWKTIANAIESYHSYPRIVGETGGKDFIFAHPTADVPALVTAMVRGAYEYQGQKCSAASRAYIPSSLWPEVKDALVAMINALKMGPVEDFTNFVNAVIDKAAYTSIKKYIDDAKESPDAEILAGGTCDDSKGFFIEPTLIQAKKPDYVSMKEEIFGPVLTLYVYEDADLDHALALCDTTSPYALTGAVFAQDRRAIAYCQKALTNTAGNFYINDKPTGAVVGQQPFGGARASGTNDKAGSLLNLIRWTSPRTIKETFVPPHDYPYPFMAEK